MKYLVSLLIFCLLIVSCECNYYESNGGELTEKQIEYAKQVMSAPAIDEAVWKNTKVLDVTFGSGTRLDNDPNDKGIKSFAHAIAEDMAKKGFAYTGMDTCVRILNPEKKELGYACIDYDSF